MNKALNLKVKQEVAIGLVAASTAKAGTKIVNDLRKLRLEIRDVLLAHFEQHVPELLDRNRQLALLQTRTLGDTSLSNIAVKGEKGQTAFGLLAWRLSTRNDVRELLWDEVVDVWSASEVLTTYRFDGHFPSMNLTYTYADVPFHTWGAHYISRDGVGIDKIYHNFHKRMVNLHDKIVVLLNKLKDILEESYDVFKDVEAALVPIKSVKVLLELMPEAGKHLPTGFYTPKEKQALADPAIINNIRAKLAAGLPV